MRVLGLFIEPICSDLSPLCAIRMTYRQNYYMLYWIKVFFHGSNAYLLYELLRTFQRWLTCPIWSEVNCTRVLECKEARCALSRYSNFKLKPAYLCCASAWPVHLPAITLFNSGESTVNEFVTKRTIVQICQACVLEFLAPLINRYIKDTGLEGTAVVDFITTTTTTTSFFLVFICLSVHVLSCCWTNAVCRVASSFFCVFCNRFS